jgi:hypothetical protein
MSVNIPTHFVQQFANTVQLLAQQLPSKLEATVESGTHIGEQASPVDQFAKIEAQENTERYTDMPRVDADTDRRWVVPRDFDLPQLVSPRDLLRLMNDPKAPLARAAVAAMNRKKDLVILQGLNGTNLTGKSGTVSTTFPSTQVVGVSTGGTTSKVNVAKLREARRILMANDVDVDNEELWFVGDASAHDALLAEIQVVSKDYNEAKDGKPIMVDGKITRFMGFNFKHSQQVFTGTDDAAGTSTACFAYAKSGAYLAKWADVSTRIDQRPDLRDVPTQLYTKMSVNGTRLDEKKVVRIWSR